MRRARFALLLMLALLVGFAARGMAYRSPIEIQAPRAAANREMVDLYYSTLNDALAGKGSGPVAALLSPLFQDHNPASGEARTAESFLAEIQAIGASSTHVQLDVLSVEPAGSTLIALVQQVGAEPVELAALAVEQAPPAPHVELLHVERGKVVDRWAPAFWWLEVSSLAEEAPTISNAVSVSSSLARIELDGPHEHSWRSAGIGIVMIERGSVSVQISGAQTAVAPMVLAEGDIASIPSGMRARVRSADGGPVSLLRYLVSQLGASDATVMTSIPEDTPQGGTRTFLWAGLRDWSRSNLANTPASVVLPPRSELRLALPEDVELLTASSAGGIEITSQGSLITVQGEDGWPEILEGFGALDETRAAWIEGGQDVTLRNVSGSPVTLLLISVAVASHAS